ncbi:sulfate ABC transporter substrate-binding protein [Aciduricibacillus chroicocephali]|uniref:Sulfate ABC transporter substrate-binding protein n=1 Tax=Aciduricibacillus chroicocephali TaxID=3054939 RepID=A0ABY9KW57_9BACI|nr:sulfate ABC transporter substrate-binding protein [Bacillaceae bacterium 44XB]
MYKRFGKKFILIAILIVFSLITAACGNSENASNGKAKGKKTRELLNVSYDPTRELYKEFNTAFSKHWEEETGEKLTIKQSHGGSGAQGRSIIDGVNADVATLALAYDIDAIAESRKLLPDNWQEKLPENSTPYTSTIVFLVRKGNPKQIKDWDDLVRKDVSIVTPNPKTSGGARWNYLAAWIYAKDKYNGDEQKIKGFMKNLFSNVAALDSGARGATTSFVERGIGDVLIAWENEAILSLEELDKNKFDIVAPSISILTEPPVAVVEKNADKNGNREVAEAYLKYLYTEEGQEIAAKHYYRPRNKEIYEKYKDVFPEVKLVTINDEFGDWQKAQKTHFADGGTFDEIYQK